MFGRFEKLKETKHYLEILTNKNLHILAFKCCIACFYIFLYKRYVKSKTGIIIMGHPVQFVKYGRGLRRNKLQSVHCFVYRIPTSK